MIQVVNASNDLAWMVTRNTSAFLMKRRGVNHHFSKDPMNPKGIYKPRFAGSVQKRALSVVEAANGKGVVLQFKNKKSNKPGKAITKVPLARGSRKALKTIKNFVNKQHYRKDLKTAALRKASALLKGQRVKNAPKNSKAKKE